MNTRSPAPTKDENHAADNRVWFVYDGECPVCSYAAHALRIKQSVGDLVLVNARDNAGHPLVREVTEAGLDLDDGMVMKLHGELYHGDDALHMMAMLGSKSGWFNRTNALLFRSRRLAHLCYPPMRAGRNLLLRLNDVDKISNLTPERPGEPIFKQILRENWDALPKVMRDHYAVRPYSNDKVTVRGTLDVAVSPLAALLARTTGMLIAQSGKDVPVTVTFRSGPTSAAFRFDREFSFPGQKPVHFRSRMERVSDNILIEFMRFGIGWKFAFDWRDGKITLDHRGYIWRIFGITLPIPGELLLGKGAAEETPLTEQSFAMWTHTKHRLFGKMFGYAGTFEVTEVSCPEKS